jgi:D-alanine-D-alanine ligase
VSHIQSTDFGKVAVLFGGNSGEREVSLNSGQAVLQALLAQGINAEGFDPAVRPITEITAYDRAFIVLHGRGGEDGQIQGLLEWLNLPYTGSGVLASALGMNKAKTKQLWQGCGLPTAPYRLLDQDTDFALVVQELGLPLIIKPVHEGSSIGMASMRPQPVAPTALNARTASVCNCCSASLLNPQGIPYWVSLRWYLAS